MATRKGLGQANILRTNNNTSTGYGIVYADEVSGHRTVANLTALYALNDWQLSASGDNTGSDAIGQLWYVVDADGNGNGCYYQLKDWSKRNVTAGWSIANMEQNAEGLGIHNVYASYAAMVADASAPVGSNGKALRFGQLVVIYDSNNTTQAESGNVYAWQEGNTGTAAWLLMGNLGNIHALQSQIDSLLSSDEGLKGQLSELDGEIDTLNQKTKDITLLDTYQSLDKEPEYGAVIKNNGEILSGQHESYCIYKYIVQGIQTIYITATTHWARALWAFYEEDGSVCAVGDLSESGSASTTINEKKVAVPQNAYYVRVATRVNSVFPDGDAKILVQRQPKRKYEGKKWYCVGYSLTAIAGNYTSKHYYDYIVKEYGFSVQNIGKGGTGYMRRQEFGESFRQRMQGFEDAELITIFGSFNDASFTNLKSVDGTSLGFTNIQQALGNVTDVGTNTICGCINETLCFVRETYPLVPFGIIAPTPWIGNEPLDENSTNHRLYVEMLEQCCVRNGVPFLNLWTSSNLHPSSEEFRALCYSKDVGGDGNPSGVHPDENGHKIIAPRFKAFLDSLIM